MAAMSPSDHFVLLLSSTMQNAGWVLSANCQIKYVRRARVREISRMWDVHVGLGQICKSLGVDVCLTLGDIGPINPGVPHVIYLHQPYLVYPEPCLMAVLPWYERVRLLYQRWHFGHSAKRAASIIVQTPIMADRLIRMYDIERQNVRIIYPVLPAHVRGLRASQSVLYSRMSPESSSLSLLFLATYYAHKNHAIIPALITELRERGLADKIHLFLTLDGNRRRAETLLLNRLESSGDMVTNLGRLKPGEVGSALCTADALFMPTLAETVGLIYLEAIAVGKPILTSDRDFARYVCGDLALYFDPLDPVSITEAILRFLEDPNYWRNLVKEKAAQCLERFSSTDEENAEAFLNILRQAL
jgi:glycosyltransferase involved in cell wall biosynthesis